MQQGRSARITDQQAVTLTPELADVMSRAYLSDLSLSPAQIRMMNGFAQSFFWSHEDSFMQHRAGLLDEQSWTSDLASIRSALLLPAFRVGWRMTRAQIDGVYRDFIDAQLKDVKPLKDFPEATIWKRMMEKELAAVEAAPVTRG